MNIQDWNAKHIELLSKGEVDKAISVKQEYMPDKLYKYFNLQELRDKKLEGFAMDHVWICGVTNQNDVYDSVLHYDQHRVATHLIKEHFTDFTKRLTDQESFSEIELALIKNADDPMEAFAHCMIQKYPAKAESIVAMMVPLRKIMKENEDGILQAFIEKVRNSIKISCFTEVHDAPDLWDRYGRGHTGYCLEYNFKELLPGDLRNRCMHPVTYLDHRFDVTRFMVGEEDALSLMGMIASLHKGTRWAVEKEWRLIIPGGMMEADTNFMMPSPKAVYLGKNTNEEDSEQIMAIAAMKKIPVYRMETSLTSLEMVARPL
jgi:hypothetical protein